MRILSLITTMIVVSFGSLPAVAQDSVRSYECIGLNHAQVVQAFSLSIDSSTPSIGLTWRDGGAISGSPETVTFVRDAAAAERSPAETVYLTIAGVKYRAELFGLTGDSPSIRMHAVTGSDPSSAGLEARCRPLEAPIAASMTKASDSVGKPADQMLGWTRIASPLEFQCSFIDKDAISWSASLALSPNPSNTISDFAKFETNGKTFESEPANLASRLVDGQRVIAGLLTFKDGPTQFLVSARVTGPLVWMNVVEPQNNPADIPYGDGVCRLLEVQG